MLHGLEILVMLFTHHIMEMMLLLVVNEFSHCLYPDLILQHYLCIIISASIIHVIIYRSSSGICYAADSISLITSDIWTSSTSTCFLRWNFWHNEAAIVSIRCIIIIFAMVFQEFNSTRIKCIPSYCCDIFNGNGILCSRGWGTKTSMRGFLWWVMAIWRLTCLTKSLVFFGSIPIINSSWLLDFACMIHDLMFLLLKALCK